MSDAMIVNSKLLLITMSRGIKFLTVKHVPTRTANQLIKYFERVMKIDSRSIMIVHNFLMDMSFYNTTDELMVNVVVNTSYAK